ncbi:GNAT family N-acetyltransferase [Amnibacterium flavum]|uniref:GNAT family N-acetyltransferase n=2 Tax=Amnibacterium flavum TaxID=2173173 RepID=A0A2V1HRG6_9MICO|nr:GNAT family N-acetyltransferase [Amnibacterium flavum]
MQSRTLYQLLRLRIDVFVVEQHAAYADIDGRDAEPGALLVWAEDESGTVISTARVLREPGGMRIGRVATAPSARGRGIAAAIMRHSISLCGDAEILLDAQAQLTDWYAGFGFELAGGEYLEDGIPHFPMRRPAVGA